MGPEPLYLRGHAVAHLVDALRYKPEGRMFDSPIMSLDFFHWHNPSGRTMALGTTRSLTEMSSRNISGGGVKGGRCVGLTTLPPSSADCLQIWWSQPPRKLQGFSRPVMGFLYLNLYPFTLVPYSPRAV
jgi:hypothetical protein